jgi:hypothetical protein
MAEMFLPLMKLVYFRLRNNIFGEESNQFTNSLGTSVNLEVTSDKQLTRYIKRRQVYLLKLDNSV